MIHDWLVLVFFLSWHYEFTSIILFTFGLHYHAEMHTHFYKNVF